MGGADEEGVDKVGPMYVVAAGDEAAGEADRAPGRTDEVGWKNEEGPAKEGQKDKGPTKEGWRDKEGSAKEE